MVDDKKEKKKILWLGLPIGRTDGDPVADTDFGSLVHFAPHCGIENFRRFISISPWHFPYSHRSIFTTLGEMTNADKIMNPQNFEGDPGYYRITQEIWIRFSDQFWLRPDAENYTAQRAQISAKASQTPWRRFALSGQCSSVCLWIL